MRCLLQTPPWKSNNWEEVLSHLKKSRPILSSPYNYKTTQKFFRLQKKKTLLLLQSKPDKVSLKNKSKLQCFIESPKPRKNKTAIRKRHLRYEKQALTPKSRTSQLTCIHLMTKITLRTPEPAQGTIKRIYKSQQTSWHHLCDHQHLSSTLILLKRSYHCFSQALLKIKGVKNSAKPTRQSELRC